MYLLQGLKMDATIPENIATHFPINEDPFALTCRLYCVYRRRRKYRALKAYVSDLLDYVKETNDRSGCDLLWVLDLYDGFLA